MMSPAYRTELNDVYSSMKIKAIVSGTMICNRDMARSMFSNDPPQMI